MKLLLVTEKTLTSITLDDAKKHLRVTHSEDDDYIYTLILVAHDFCENYTNRKYEAETWKLLLDKFPNEIELPFSPVSSVTHVKYYDTDNAQQPLVLNTDYEYSLNSEPVVIRPIGSWPGVYDKYEAIEVQFVCGVTAPEATPPGFRHAMKLLISDMYNKRESTVHRYPTTVDQLLIPLKMY